MCRLDVYILIVFAVVTSAKNYVFPGCEMKLGNTFETGEEEVSIWVADFAPTTPMTVEVSQSGKIVNPIEVPLPHWTWTPILVNMTEKLKVSLPDGSTYPMDEEYQEEPDPYPIKLIHLWSAYSMVDCPQGLPYQTVDDDYWSFSFPGDRNADEIYLLLPLVNLKAYFKVCGKSQCSSSPLLFICFSEDEDQLTIQESSSMCHELSAYTFYRLQLHFENGHVKVMTNNQELGSFPGEVGDRVRFSTIGRWTQMIVIQCWKENCEEPEPPKRTTSASETTTMEGTTDLSQNDEEIQSCIIAWGPPTAIAILMSFAWIFECFRRRRQVNELRAANNRQMPTVHFQNSPHSNAPTATSSATPNPAVTSVMTENNIYVSFDEMRQ